MFLFGIQLRAEQRVISVTRMLTASRLAHIDRHRLAWTDRHSLAHAGRIRAAHSYALPITIEQQWSYFGSNYLRSNIQI